MSESSDDDGYIDAHKELYQLAEDNGEIETRQINIKIEVVRSFCLHLRHVQPFTKHEGVIYTHCVNFRHPPENEFIEPF